MNKSLTTNKSTIWTSPSALLKGAQKTSRTGIPSLCR